MANEEVSFLLELLNAPTKETRLQALREIKKLIESGAVAAPVRGKDVNSHIHSIYSFSPYSPTKAVFRSWESGLLTTGIMDHDSISGAYEFIEAGKIMGMPTTIGAELRASFEGTVLEGKRINNPDQSTVAYVAMHGIPHTAIPALREFFAPLLVARGIRNRAMIEKINEILLPADISIDYDKDVLPLSMAHEGGSVTERHLLFAVAKKMTEKFGRGDKLVNFLDVTLGITAKGKIRELLLDESNEIYDYDLLNVLKGNMVEQFYIPATDETPAIAKVSKFAADHGIILAYAYLGDITESVTGDKKAQHFEDEFLDEVFETIREQGFKAVTYMPSRNTAEQLVRLRDLCDKNGFFQISGEDINQPRQKFVCEAMRNPEFANLIDAAWALIGHEWSATEDMSMGMFSDEMIKRFPNLLDRVDYFKKYALKRFAN